MATQTTQIGKNQYDYLTNMAAGKAAAGGAANAGQQKWAAGQLKSSTYTPPAAQATTPAVKPTMGTGVFNAMTAGANAAKSGATPTPAATAAATTMATQYSPTKSTLNTLQTAINTPFSYDINTDPAYQAALALAKQNISQQQSDTNAQLRATGQGKSSYSETVANQIGTKEMGRISTEVVPTLMQQAYQRNQDQIANNGNLYSLQNQEYFQNPITESAVTGNYMSGEARNAIDQLLSLKQQAETKGITAEARSGLSSQADQIRAFLQSQGINPELFGANVSANTATSNIGQAGTRTLQGQQTDLQNKQANWNAYTDTVDRSGTWGAGPAQNWGNLIANANAGNQTMTGQQNASGLMSEQQNRDINTRNAAITEWQTVGTATPSVAEILGVPVGTPTSDQAYRDASTALEQDKFTYSQWSDAANAAGKANSTATQTVSAATAGDMLSAALQKVVGTDTDTGKTKYGVYSDPAKREEAFVTMINTTGLRGNDVITALTKAGYSIKEINALQAQYPEVFQ
ncbi:hypothetical protein BBD42_13165 [Paenibacillus sp. BIHB 4019]|uniref:Uncharacterized protein n=1 Tax=Paenibacillus sp. BIHB 4019 TaxID=1870819 RepID=A0A1B2DHX5_9BACL|nr:hypothetical protein [Paenibacillus sp. BIHB 4019]ANY67318.1 hypothetical protein BBD42_13165 [Paenibacillus sp. BIHB 4019]